MFAQPPSRLPRAFISVSRCPICAYSLKDIGEELPCPECGTVIDRDLLTSPEMQDAVTATKTWCILGIIAWGICAFGYWALSIVTLSVMNGYYPGTYGSSHYAGVWFRTAFVIAPVALSVHWFRKARRTIYKIAMKRQQPLARTPQRVVLLNLFGVLLLFGGCLLLVFTNSN